MKKTIIFIISFQLLTVVSAKSQIIKHVTNRVAVGYSNFYRHNESGLYLSNETIFLTNKYINPSLKISFAYGFHDVTEAPFGYMSSGNSLNINTYTDILNKKIKLNVSEGIGILLYFYNDVLAIYPGILPNRSVYETVTTGQIQTVLNYQMNLAYQFSRNFSLGIQFSQQFSKNKYKVTTVSLTGSFKI